MSYAHDDALEERRPVTGYSRAASGSSSSWGAELLAAAKPVVDAVLAVHAARLGVERFDLLLLHRDDEAVPAAEVVELLEGLRAEGLALSWVGTGRCLFSLDFTPEQYAQTQRALVAAADSERVLAAVSYSHLTLPSKAEE